MNKGIFAANFATFSTGIAATHGSLSYGMAVFILSGICLGIFVTVLRARESGAIGIVRPTERTQQRRLTPTEIAIGSSLISLMAAPFCYMLFAFLFL